MDLQVDLYINLNQKEQEQFIDEMEKLCRKYATTKGKDFRFTFK